MGKKYFVCDMAEAKGGMGIVSEDYYHANVPAKDHATGRPFTCKVLFEGGFEQCKDFKSKRAK